MLKSKTLIKLCSQCRNYSTFSQRKKICVIGSGPAGFYTTQILLRSKLVEVDIYEKLPVPFGLIRYGVAPDHPEIKNVINSFTDIANEEYCSFFGNIKVGKDVTISELSSVYHAIVLAYGAEKDRKLSIPGEDSKNVLSAREFVSWYNGHPDFVNIDVNLDTEVALVIGHGNVALDVGRILLQSIDVLEKTDIAEHALEVLKKSRVRKVIIAGRRGPLQVSFTIKEFREMTKLPGCDCIMHPEDFVGIADLISSLERPRKRLTELMCTTVNKEHEQKHAKSWELQFYRNPKAAVPDSQGRVKEFVLGINKLKELGISKPPEILDTGDEDILKCGLVLKSVGYQSLPIDPSIPFDENKCIVPNKKGKVVKTKGLYCSGWIKTGPKGVILPTMYSSYDTAEALLEDIEKGELDTNPSMERNDLLELLKKRGVKFITFEEWKKINEVEKQRGQAKGKPREKLHNIEEILKIANVA